MRCPNCGQELRDEDEFCANCGAPRPLETTPEPHSDPYGNLYGDASPHPMPSFPINVPPPARQAIPKPQSFVPHAFLALLLYFFFWFPGLIVNIVFWNDAKKVLRDTGSPPRGYGCLGKMLVMFLIFPILGICYWFMFFFVAE